MYNRISIVGGSGTGKSTLCDILSKELNLKDIPKEKVLIFKKQKYLNKWLKDLHITRGLYH